MFGRRIWSSISLHSSSRSLFCPSPFFASSMSGAHFCAKAMSGGDRDARSKQTNDLDIEQLLERNKQWVSDTNKNDPTFFNELAKGQSPKYLYIGCSDSRVPATQILGLKPGELFVHRNIGNMVPGNDLNALSVLEYAVEHLKVQHIIVAGHYDCGAVRAASKTQDLGMIENWLRGIRDVHRLHCAELDAIEDEEKQHRRLVELNVVEQCLNLYKTAVVQRQRLKTHLDPAAPFAYPRIHAVAFDPADGLMQKLKIDFKSTIDNYKHVYDLYDTDGSSDDGAGDNN